MGCGSCRGNVGRAGGVLLLMAYRDRSPPEKALNSEPQQRKRKNELNPGR